MYGARAAAAGAAARSPPLEAGVRLAAAVGALGGNFSARRICRRRLQLRSRLAVLQAALVRRVHREARERRRASSGLALRCTAAAVEVERRERQPQPLSVAAAEAMQTQAEQPETPPPAPER